MTRLEIEEKVVKMLKTVYDPEIPVDIYELGLVYKIDVADDMTVNIDMTLTAPNCPAADFIVEDVRQKVESIDGVKAADRVVFDREGIGQVGELDRKDVRDLICIDFHDLYFRRDVHQRQRHVVRLLSFF